MNLNSLMNVKIISNSNKVISNPKKYCSIVFHKIRWMFIPFLDKLWLKLIGLGIKGMTGLIGKDRIDHSNMMKRWEAIAEKMNRLFVNTSFFLQGRMDIEPKSVWHSEDFNNQTGGFFIPDDKVKREVIDLHTWDQVRRDMMILLLRSILERQVPGDLVEVGVYQGLTAKMIHYYAPERKLYLFDTFDISDEKDMAVEKKETGMEYSKDWFIDTNIEQVWRYIDKRNDNIIIYQGYFPDSIPGEFNGKKFAFVHIDVSLYKPTKDALNYFYGKMSSGGFIVLHDYNSNPSVRRPTDEFMKDKMEIPIPMPDKSGSVLIVKQ